MTIDQHSLHGQTGRRTHIRPHYVKTCVNIIIIIIMKIVQAVHIQAERQTNRQIENEYKIIHHQ